MDQQSKTVAFQSCTITLLQERASESQALSAASTPDTSLLGRAVAHMGSGRTLLLVALMGEADVLAEQVLCPRSPLDSFGSFVSAKPSPEDWIVEGICPFVPQAAWLRNASIKDALSCCFLRVIQLTSFSSSILFLEDMLSASNRFLSSPYTL